MPEDPAGCGYQPPDLVLSCSQLKLLGTAEVKSLPESADVRKKLRCSKEKNVKTHYGINCSSKRGGK